MVDTVMSIMEALPDLAFFLADFLIYVVAVDYLMALSALLVVFVCKVRVVLFCSIFEV